MTFTFKRAMREQVSVLIGLAGPSGSGKTYTALRLACGLAPNGKIAFIDTEARRGLHYADKFEYHHTDMRPPFKPARFIECIQDAENSGAEVIIIDSFSNEYDGEGGIIDWADELEGRGVKSPGNWKEPKLAHKKMMNAFLQCRASLIFCLRADEKIKIVRQENGKTAVVPLGWTPICEKRFMYEMTTSFTLTDDNAGKPNFNLPHKLQEQHRHMFPADEFIGENAGRALKEWASGGIGTMPTDEPDSETLITADSALAEAAEKGSEALKTAWTKLPAKVKAALKTALDTRHKAAAALADQRLAA